MQQVSLWKSPLNHTEEKHSRVKMAVMKFLIYFTCFGLSQDLVSCDDYGESGKEITLTPSIRGKPEDILWTLNSNKVLEYDGSQVETYGSFKDRVEVDFETGQLTIRKLNSQDSGTYQSEILINKKPQVSSHYLTVLDALPEPEVTCELDETTNDKKLTCSVESQTQLSYEWIGPDVKQTGPTLLVKENEENRNPVYTCTVKNKAGTRTTDFALQDCHTVNLAVLVPVVIIVLLLIIVLAVLVLYLYRRKMRKYARELEKAELKLMDPENGVCDTLMKNMEAVPGSLEATLPCRTRLTAPKESIADKKWGQGSESENGGETHEEEKLLKESLQSAKTENEEANGSTNEGELEINQENCQNAEEKATSKADEREEIQRQTQEGIEKSQKLKDESEDREESSGEQTDTPGEQDTTDTDTIDEDQRKKEDEEEVFYLCPNTAEENANSKADEREVEIQKYSQTQEEMDKWENDSEDKEESSEEQIETSGKQDTTNADTNEQDQKPEEKKDEENKYKEMDSLSTGKIQIEALGEQDTIDTGINDEDQTTEEKEDKEEENKDSVNTVYTGDVAEQLHKNEKSSQNENRDQQNKSVYRSVEEDDRRPGGQTEEEEKTKKENHEGTAEHCNPPLHSEAPSDPVDSPPNLDSVPSSNLNIELENKQTAFVPQQEDDDDEQTDKSSESEQGMEEKKDVATA